MQAVRKFLLSSGESPRIPLSVHEKSILPPRYRKWGDSLFGLLMTGFTRSHEVCRFPQHILLLMYQYTLNKKQEVILRRPDVKRMMALEIACAKNKFIETYDCQKCPNCSLFIYRRKAAISKLRCYSCCPLCSKKFCWMCRQNWNSTDIDGKPADFCGNDQCDTSLTMQKHSILKTCPTKRIKISYYSLQIPAVRACPKCYSLIFHITTSTSVQYVHSVIGSMRSRSINGYFVSSS